MVLTCGEDNPTEKKRLGLVPHHVYTVIDVGEGSGGMRFLRLRNPWGTEEWTGPWSDNDENWTTYRHLDVSLRKEKGYSASTDDGAFWIDLNDAYKFFCKADWCWFSKALFRRHVFGSWNAGTAGGARGQHAASSFGVGGGPCWDDNPRYQLDVDHEGIVVISVSCTDRRFSEDAVVAYEIGFELLKSDLTPQVPRRRRHNSSEGFWGELTPGKYWIVPDAGTGRRGIEGDFVVKVASKVTITLHDHDPSAGRASK